MAEICTDNRFELIEEFKKKLIESTNIETSQEEMKVIDNILFRFWQMGWLESIDRMPLVKESAKTLIRSVGDSVSAKAFRNAGRFMQNAIDGEAQEYELGKASSEIPNNSDTISRQDAIIELVFNEETKDIKCEDIRKVLNVLKKLSSASTELSNNSPKLDNKNGELISRQAAVDTLDTIGYDFSESGLSEHELEEVCEAVGNVRQDMISRIKNLPSASTDLSTFSDKLWKIAYERGKAEGRKKGKWIDEGQYAESHSEHEFRCSECGGHIIEIRPDDFCKHCGADMREGDSE